MTQELSETRFRNGSQILIKRRLDSPDATGCNWSADVDVSGGFNTLAQHESTVRPAAMKIVDRARLLFNIV
jgi:hypothetical protein